MQHRKKFPDRSEIVVAPLQSGNTQVALDRKVLEHVAVLRHKTDAELNIAMDRARHHGMSIERDGSGARAERSDAAFEQRRLAGTIMPEHRDAFAFFEAQRNVLERMQRTVISMDIDAGEQARHARHAPKYSSVNSGLRTISSIVPVWMIRPANMNTA